MQAIELTHPARQYGTLAAPDDVNFSVGRGHVWFFRSERRRKNCDNTYIDR